MKLILLQDIRGLGRKYEVKEVSDGHARNFLLPKKLAEAATPEALKRLAAHQAETEKEDAELSKRFQEIAQTLTDQSLEISMKADGEGNVFGSVNKDSILKAMREHGWVTKERVEVILEHPLKKLGDYKVPIHLKKGLETELRVRIIPA